MKRAHRARLHLKSKRHREVSRWHSNLQADDSKAAVHYDQHQRAATPYHLQQDAVV